MYKIGFIDYYLSEWHANNYPAWFSQVCERSGYDFTVAYAYAPVEVSPVDGITTDEWCAKYGVERCGSVKELCEKSDYVVILAPSNPETHLELCREAFPHYQGRRMYIDKTFAPDLETAKEIFALAEKYDVKFFSTSALRYCINFKDIKNVESVTTYYGGSNLEEYIIHQIESVVKIMGAGAERIKAESDGEAIVYDIEFSDGRIAHMNYKEDNGYRARVEFADGSVWEDSLTGGHFIYLSEKILDFFLTGEIDYDSTQTLDVMAIRDKAIYAKEHRGIWLTL